MPSRKPFDMTSPDAKRIRNEIVHGSFVKEGTMVAFPLCFPGCSEPIRADESRITAIDVAPGWMVYGGTSGRAAHLLVGMFHGATGMVLDLGVVDGADETAAVCCGAEHVIALVNGPAGGRAIRAPLQGLPFDLLQEWGFARPELEDLGEIAPGERVVHAVAAAGRERIVGVTENHLFTIDPATGKVELIAEMPGLARLAGEDAGGVLGLDGADALWRYNPADGSLHRQAIPLPGGADAWGAGHATWAQGPAGGLYLADDLGRLFSLTEQEGLAGPLGQTQFAPVGAMAVTPDGRLFGACGEGIARLFCYHPSAGQVDDLGCAVSVLQRRRYGYVFAAAATGRDGQLYFAENDDLGHLWIYFPRIL